MCSFLCMYFSKTDEWHDCSFTDGRHIFDLWWCEICWLSKVGSNSLYRVLSDLPTNCSIISIIRFLLFLSFNHICFHSRYATPFSCVVIIGDISSLLLVLGRMWLLTPTTLIELLERFDGFVRARDELLALAWDANARARFRGRVTTVTRGVIVCTVGSTS